MEKYKQIIEVLEQDKKYDIRSKGICEVFNYANIKKDKNYKILKDLTRSQYNRIAKRLKSNLYRNYKIDVVIDEDNKGNMYSRTRFVENLTQDEKKRLYDALVIYINKNDNIKRYEYLPYSKDSYTELEEMFIKRKQNKETQYQLMNLVDNNIINKEDQYVNLVRGVSVYLYVIDYINEYYLEMGKLPEKDFLDIKM